MLKVRLLTSSKFNIIIYIIRPYVIWILLITKKESKILAKLRLLLRQNLVKNIIITFTICLVQDKEYYLGMLIRPTNWLFYLCNRVGYRTYHLVYDSVMESRKVGFHSCYIMESPFSQQHWTFTLPLPHFSPPLHASYYRIRIFFWSLSTNYRQ